MLHKALDVDLGASAERTWTHSFQAHDTTGQEMLAVRWVPGSRSHMGYLIPTSPPSVVPKLGPPVVQGQCGHVQGQSLTFRKSNSSRLPYSTGRLKRDQESGTEQWFKY